jgi:hypothetical protein
MQGNFGYSFNGESTQIHPDKLQAYRATDYRIDNTPQVIVLSIGYQHIHNSAADGWAVVADVKGFRSRR